MSVLASVGSLRDLVARALPRVTDLSIVEISKYCTDLKRLDISGCWQITEKSIFALQENLMHMRNTTTTSFHLTIGGTDIDGERAVQFAATTGSSISLHNLSVSSFQEDYHSLLESGECLRVEKECLQLDT